jgi:KDO2-lipid IV(A) lauroyltransferase
VSLPEGSEPALPPPQAAGPALPPWPQRLLPRAGRALADGLSRLPRERARAWALRLGRCWARLGGPRSEDARRNLRIAFPEWGEARRERVLERALANLAAGAVEFATMARLSEEARRGLATVEGEEHLERARQDSPSGGVVVLTAHYGAWELLVSIMASRGWPIAVVRRARSNRLFEQVLSRWRASSGVEFLPRGNAARAALRALRRGRYLAMTLDQDCPRSEGVFVPFLGRLACTRDGPARLAMLSGAAVVPIFIERVGQSSRHRIRVEPPLELVGDEGDREAAVVENVRRMAAVVERAIRRAPEQWIWIHRRWRTQPVGEPRPYRARPRRRRRGERTRQLLPSSTIRN